MKVYLAGPMRGIPQFNFPKFKTYARKLRELGYDVFSPAEKDEDRHGKDFSKAFPTGSLEDAEEGEFSLRVALGDDLEWICKHADAVALLPGWQQSLGAIAEKATGEALGLQIMYIVEDMGEEWLIG